jgi:DNA-binding beta-propeller fold protein YncE
MLYRLFIAGLCLGWSLTLVRKARGADTPLTSVQTVQLPQLTGGTNHLAADAKRHRFFVTAPGDKKVVVVDLNAGRVLKVIEGVPAAAAIFLPDLDQLCVSGGSGVAFYDGHSLAPLGNVDLNAAVDELQYDPRSKRVYAGVMDANDPGIAVIDAAGRKLLQKMKLPAKPQGFVIEQHGPRVYANTPAK